MKFLVAAVIALTLAVSAQASGRAVVVQRSFVPTVANVQVTQFSTGVAVVEPLNSFFLNTGTFVPVGNGFSFSSNVSVFNSGFFVRRGFVGRRLIAR